MKTVDILALDCKDENNIKILNKFLYKIKPIEKITKGVKYEQIPLEMLEKTLHGIMIKYKYRMQWISNYFEDNKFIYYSVSLCCDREKQGDWIGVVYGVTLWELIAKAIIKIYADIKKNN